MVESHRSELECLDTLGDTCVRKCRAMLLEEHREVLAEAPEGMRAGEDTSSFSLTDKEVNQGAGQDPGHTSGDGGKLEPENDTGWKCAYKVNHELTEGILHLVNLSEASNTSGTQDADTQLAQHFWAHDHARVKDITER